MKRRTLTRLLAGCLAAMLVFNDASGVLATELSEETIAGSEQAEATEVSTETETTPIYQAYLGLPSVLAPSAPESTSAEWSGDRVYLGKTTAYIYGEDYANSSMDSWWRILDPEKGLLFADGIYFTSDSGIEEKLAAYETSQTSDGYDKFNTAEQAAIETFRLPTKAEMMNTAYGFNDVETSDETRSYASYSYRLQDEEVVVDTEDSESTENTESTEGTEGAETTVTTSVWVQSDGAIGDSATNSSYAGCAPIAELDTSKVFMTIYSDFYEYGGYAKVDISGKTSRFWNLLLHSGDEGFAATLPETASMGDYYTVDVTALGGLSYDAVGIVLADAEGNVVVYDKYEDSELTTGSYDLYIPSEVKAGNYTVKVFAENTSTGTTSYYVSNIVEGTVKVVGPEITNLSIAQTYGKINLNWELANVESGYNAYREFAIYRADSENGEYKQVDTLAYNTSSLEFSWSDTDVRASEAEVNNGTYYYKVVYINADTGNVESDVITNKGLYYGTSDDYVGVYLTDKEGNQLTSLTLHEGEAINPVIVLVSSTGEKTQLELEDDITIRWYLYSQYRTTEDFRSGETVSSDKLGIYPAKLATDSEGNYSLPEDSVYIQAEEGAAGTYYLTLYVDGNQTEGIWGSWYWQIPVTVVEAEVGVTYEQREDIGIAATQEAAEQKLRDLMVARDNESVVIVENGVSISSDTIFDIYAEREGMKPEEGDYLYYQVGYADITSFFWETYESSDIPFNGGSYTTYRSTTPFITTAAQEAEIDAKVDALVHTPGGALYEGNYSTDEEKVGAIYDWIVANVNPAVEGDRTTPIYHTVYSALFNAYGGYPGSGTCEAFALLFTRLSREMGIASKVIMGVDAGAHTYNIVELEGKWYYIDASTQRYLSGSDTFVRAEEQERYQDERFVTNYINKISEQEYGFVAKGTLSYTEDDGTAVTVEVADFSAAVAKINNLKTKRDYTITLNRSCSVNAITMPDKNYVKTLTIEGVNYSVELSHQGNITLTSDTILKNITIKGKSANAAFSLNTGDYALTIEESVNITTPVNITSGKNGSLTVTENGQLYMSGSLDVTTLNNAGGLFLQDDSANCSAKVTDAILTNGRLYSAGSIQITNLRLEGKSTVEAVKAFDVTGTLVNASSDAILYTRMNEKNVPYLNITGTVTLEDNHKIQVGVYPAEGTTLMKLEAGSQLLTVKTATADMFVPVADNVGGVGEYPAEDGYFLQKTKTEIYLYYGDVVETVLCKGTVDTGNLADAEMIGYFMSFADAVAAIDERKSEAKTASYTIVLMKDVNTESAPAALKLPTQAQNVIITSVKEEMYDIFFTGNIALKTNTEFVNVRLNPMNAKKQGVTANITAGKFNLTLRNIEVGSIAGMAIKDVSAGNTSVLTFATAGLALTGNVSGAKEVVVEQSLTVKGNVKATALTIENGKSESVTNKFVVGGTLTVTGLELQGYAVLDVAGTVSLTNIYNSKTDNVTGTQANAIYYDRAAKGAPNLTVKGVISGNNDTPVELHYDAVGASQADYTLTMQSNKYVLNDKVKLAALEKAALSQVTFYLNDVAIAGTVKANKGVYVIDVDANANSVLLEGVSAGVKTSSYCLDYAQAINEINNIADSTADYTIHVGLLDATQTASNLTDTNLTDSNATSSITMPKKGVAASVTITSDQKESFVYSGNISYAGNLVFDNVVLLPTKEVNLSGTKNVTNISFVNTEAAFKNISNVSVLTLENADLLTTGTVTATDVVLAGEAHWNTLGKTTVTNVDASVSTSGSYIASKQTAKTLVPMFTISGKVTLGESKTPVAIKVLTPEAVAENLKEVSQYTSVSLVVAPKESADKFVAYAFTELLKDDVAEGTTIEGITADTLISYKTVKNEVASGNKTKMVVRIVEMENGSAVAETYAQSFDEAVTIINNQGDLKASYRMELLKGSEKEPIFTTKSGTTLGKLTLPTKAAEVTIAGADSSATVMLAYSGTLGINCNTSFDNIILCETTSKEQTVTIAYSGAYELTVSDSVWAYAEDDLLYLTSIKIPKGTLNLENACVTVMGDMTAKELKYAGNSILGVGGKAVITDITGDAKGTLVMMHLFNTKNATQLTVNGEIKDAKLGLIPGLYNVAAQEYYYITEEAISGKMIATMPKASTLGLTLYTVDDDGELQALTGNLYKQNGGLYYTTEEPVVAVTATDSKGTEVYGSQFLEWEQAVKEIDKRADSSLTYSMILKDNIGGTAGSEAPIKNLTLPAKAKKVIVTSETGEENHILFAANKVALKTNTSFENVGLFAIKNTSKTESKYESIGYTFAAGGFELGIDNLQYELSDTIYNYISAITGSAKGTLKVTSSSMEENNWIEADKITGFGTVVIYNAILSAGTVSVKDVQMYSGAIEAKDITVSGTAYLDHAILAAGSEAANDGKLKIKDIVVEGANNYLYGKQDKKGKTQIDISGTVTAAADYTGSGEALVIGLFKNDGSAFAQLYDGMVLLNAAKADAGWFVPAYTVYDEVNDLEIPGMGYKQSGYGLYKSGKEMKYGAF